MSKNQAFPCSISKLFVKCHSDVGFVDFFLKHKEDNIHVKQMKTPAITPSESDSLVQN